MKLIGSSYGERVMYATLTSLGVGFKTQYKFDGFNKRYDFLLEDGIIIELHGGQHYATEYRQPNWGSYEDEHNNDLYKYDLAVLHGYEYGKTFFIVDCRYSYFAWLKNNIELTLNCIGYNTDNIKWEEIEILAWRDIGKEIIDFYKSNPISTTKIAKRFGVDRHTVIKHLKWGNEKGLCSYTPKVGIKGEQIQQYRNNILIATYENTYKASESTGISQGNISSCCNGKRKTAGGFQWVKLKGEL